MVLSLTDILTMQGVDRLSKPDTNTRTHEKRSENNRFEDVLNESNENENNDSPIKDAKEYDLKEESKYSSTVGEHITSLQNINGPDSIIDAAKDIISDILGINTEVVDSAEVAEQPKITAENLTSALNAKQDTGLNNEEKTQVNAILAKLANAGIDPNSNPEKIVDQVLEQIKSTGLNSDAPVEDILEKMNLGGSKTEQELSAEELASQALATAQTIPADTAKEAAKVISVAKDEANKPEFVASDLKSIQITSLSNLGKKKDKNNEGQGELSIDDGLDSTNITLGDKNQDVRQNSSGHLQAILAKSNGLIDQQKTDNMLIQNEQGQASSANTVTTSTPLTQQQTSNLAQIINTSFSASGNAASLAPSMAANDDGINTTSKDSVNSSSPLSTDNFIKFQNLLDDAAVASKSTTNTKSGSPSEIMAQIKFGLNGKGKDESNISIQLHPKDLGKVDISMQMAADGKTYVTVIAENSDTLNLLQKEADSLKGMLTDALKTDSSNLNFSFQQGGSDNWRQQFASNQYAGNRPGMANDISSSNYLAEQSYRYNMIATDGLDIRV